MNWMKLVTAFFKLNIGKMIVVSLLILGALFLWLNYEETIEPKVNNEQTVYIDENGDTLRVVK